MEFINFLLFSILEYMAIFSLMFALYRLNSRHYWVEQFIISGVLSFFSFSLRGLFHTEAFTPAVLIILMSAFIWLILRIPFFYVAILTLPTYLVYGLLQFGVMTSLDAFGVITFAQAIENDGANIYGQVIQTITASLTLVIARVIYRTEIGFSFVPSGKVKVKLEGLNLIIAIVLSVGFAFFIFFDYWIKTKMEFFILASFFALILATLLYLSRKKDYE